VDGVFQISYGRLGPTEVRVIIILINLWFYFSNDPKLALPSGDVSVNDLVVGLLALVLILIFIVSTTQKAMELAKLNE
jgi:archaetidylinositol phosphate synthase